MKKLVYYFVKYLLWCYNDLFFRTIKIYGKGRIPQDGGVLYSPNHQAAFLDPLLVGAYTPKRITSLTRSDVFGGPLQWFLDAFQMLPVYRIRNGYSSLKNNDATFEKCYSILGNGGNLNMFSEGGHHDEYYLQNLSKGSSRLAYQAQKVNPGKKVYLMPVGLNYGNHRQARITLHLVFGEPILISEMMNPNNTDAENINTLRALLQDRMKDCMWLPEKDALYPEKKLRINKRTTELEFSHLKKILAEDYEKLPKREQITAAKQNLASLLALPNLIPLWATRKINGLFEDIVFTSSIKYASGYTVFALWWLISCSLLGGFFGNPVAIAFLAVSIGSLFWRQKILLY